MNSKPGRAFPAVLRHDKNRVGGKRNCFIADLHNADIHTVLRADNNILTFRAQAGKNHFGEDFRRDFADLRHFGGFCGCFFRFFHDGSFDQSY